MTDPKRMTAHEMHDALIAACVSETYRSVNADPDGFIEDQALFCPFYSELTGPLAGDWGVVLNPASPRFGLLTFEHDSCGCPTHGKLSGTQSGVDWLKPKVLRKWWTRFLEGKDAGPYPHLPETGPE